MAIRDARARVHLLGVAIFAVIGVVLLVLTPTKVKPAA
jgi:hypothetical protein